MDQNWTTHNWKIKLNEKNKTSFYFGAEIVNPKNLRNNRIIF